MPDDSNRGLVERYLAAYNAFRAGDSLELAGRSTFAFRNGLIARIVDES